MWKGEAVLMYVTEGSGLEVYETFEDLVNKGITAIWDYQNNYYIRVKLDDNYDNRIWVVDKKSKKVSDMFFTDFFEFIDKATEIDPETLRKRVS